MKNENDENATVDDNNHILASAALSVGCVTLTPEYDGSTTAIGHDF